MAQIARGFNEALHFPNVVGAIDPHINIKAPTKDEKLYVNRKGMHSINVIVSYTHIGSSC